MKRNLLLLAALCGIIMSVDAQKVNFGVKAGVNISSLGDYEWDILHDDVEFDAKAGLYAGVFTQIYFFKGLGIETGLFYAQLGGKDKENDYLELYEVTANPSYPELFMPAELTRNFLGETAISGQVRKKFEVIGIFHSGFSVFPEKISDFSDENRRYFTTGHSYPIAVEWFC